MRKHAARQRAEEDQLRHRRFVWLRQCYNAYALVTNRGDVVQSRRCTPASAGSLTETAAAHGWAGCARRREHREVFTCSSGNLDL